MKTKKDINEKMDKLSSELYQKKLEINGCIFSRINNYEKKFTLNNSLSDFKNLTTYIPKIFEMLWDNPKLTADLIKYCDINDIKESLADLFVNNFYQNILTNNYIENNLIFLLVLLLKDEIDNFKSGENYLDFMNKESIVGYFMGELRKKNDIKCFFKTLLFDIISDLESLSYINFTLDLQEIIDILKTKCLLPSENQKEHTSKKDKSKKTKSLSMESMASSGFYILSGDASKENTKESRFHIFTAKYLIPLTLSELKKMISDSNESSSDMNDYLTNIIKKAQNETSYSNFKLIEKLDLNKNYSDKLISLYISNFYLIKDFVDKFISVIEKNLNIIPYSIKYFCKIIALLISKKFSEINIAQRNAFISQFFFNKIIMPIFVDPGVELFINNFIISGYTLSNLNIINEILNKLFSCELFYDNDDIHRNNFTPFNWYILEKTPQILDIYNKLIDIELPSFINDIINNKLDTGFSYNYFYLNEEELIMHNSICFSYRDLKALLNGLEQLKNKVDLTQYNNGNNLLKTIQKINSNRNRNELNNYEKRENNASFVILKEKEIIESNKVKRAPTALFLNRGKNKEFLLDNINANNSNANKKLVEINYENYYLIHNLKINNENNKIFNLSSDEKKNFHIKELKETDKPENIQKNKIIKIKNFFSDLLYNISPLKRSVFNNTNISNTKEILNAIKNYSKLKNYILDTSIPPEWYIESILNLIQTIPEEYTKNDLEKLYNELEEDINTSMNNYNPNILYECLEKLNCIQKEKKNYEEIYNILKDLELNEKVKHILENDFIPVKITFNYEEKNKLFDITKLIIKKEELIKKENNNNNSNINDNSNIYIKYCDSIKSFINNFPDFALFQEMQDIDILDYQKNISVPEKLKHYFFSIIREHLTSQKIIEHQNDLFQIENKIYDYVMSKINSKIFPKTDDEDDKLFQTLFKLSWTQPKHFIKGKKNFIFETFLPDVIKIFHSIENEQSPRKKIEHINSIFESISKVVQFNGGDGFLSADDQIPILTYCFIKAQLYKICSNLKFVNLFRNSLIEKGSENQLVQLIAVCGFFKNISHKNLIDVTEEEFNKNCQQVVNGN